MSHHSNQKENERQLRTLGTTTNNLKGYFLGHLFKARNQLPLVLSEIATSEEKFLNNLRFIPSQVNDNHSNYNNEFNPREILIKKLKKSPLANLLIQLRTADNTITENVALLNAAFEHQIHTPEFQVLFSQFLDNLPATLEQCAIAADVYNQYLDYSATSKGAKAVKQAEKELFKLGITIKMNALLVAGVQRGPRYKMLLQEIMKIHDRNTEQQGFKVVFSKYDELFRATQNALGNLNEDLQNLNKGIKSRVKSQVNSEMQTAQHTKVDLPLSEELVLELKKHFDIDDKISKSNHHHKIRELQRSGEILTTCRNALELSQSRGIKVIQTAAYNNVIDEFRKTTLNKIKVG